MKKFAAILLILIPCLTFGQLFPKVPDFKGNIRQVTEKRFGKEFNLFGILKKSYYPRIYSGWKYTYLFNEHSKLIRRTNTFKQKIITEYLYQRDATDNRQIEREIITDKSSTNAGDYLEYESVINSEGRIEKVNFWSFNSKECTRQLFLVEKNVEYKDGKLSTFTRQNISTEGDTASAEKCSMFYDSSKKIIRIERMDVETGLTTILYYFYNNQGFLDHYSVDYLVGLNEYGKKNQTQDVYYKNDHQGNWIRMYSKMGNKKRLEAKRKIKYW